MADKNMVQVRLILPESYRRLFKAYCTEIGTDMSKEVAQMIEEKLIKAGKLQHTVGKSQ
ncbi:hypothetical protein DSM106972_011140 [Dulcicalothrix desertica PCC 7102]|uniref:CopG family transcriptional regulator n=1 Tax=Dulcicalothrix desertica PCC 7102 TaxID=232991 RepID=A0A3S1CRH0_9CYAN|nr:hypothetical protein [Dulcicalothrix desertica]RUT09061.1 hypothetical protein DSM106972_011140 [Dulcicalothrix desertica PCC 7102]TWH49935.1 hypothetical protein CAL7102_04203 [Dulcicalothrix desertica PCC 7102]